MVEKLTKIIASVFTNKTIVAIILGLCERLAAKTETTIDDEIIKALKESGLWSNDVSKVSVPSKEEPVEKSGKSE